MSSQIEEIKARVDIVDLISEYIRLKPAGPNNWKALCPFHNEKSPSFMVSKDKQIWHCFGCSEGGDIFTFVQKIEGIEFPEALRLLAQKAGVQLVAENPKLSSQRNRLLDLCELAAYFWHKTLLESHQGQKARDYLRKRQINERTIIDFKIGYALDSWDHLIDFLKGRGFSDQEIFLAGLSVKKERGQDFYDRFRDRLMFPINDLHGNPIGFSGRTLKTEEIGGKYINTPQTLIYNKSLVIFNLDRAKAEIKKENQVIVVEGQMDVVSAVQAGTGNVIATSGTAFTPDQIKILKRYSNNLAICFDMDLAGESAAKRGIDLALNEEMNVKVITLPVGKDPDECIKANPSLWFEAIKKAQSIMEYYFQKTFSQLDLNSPEGKKEAAKILLPLIFRLQNKIEQTHWLQKLSEAVKVPERILLESLPKNRIKNQLSAASQPQNLPVRDRNVMLYEQILAIALKYPENLSDLIDNLAPEVITDTDLNSLYKNLIIYYTESINNDSNRFVYQDFHNKIKAAGLGILADRLILLGERDFFNFDLDAIRSEMVKTIAFTKRNYLNLLLKEIERKINDAEKSGQKDEVKKLVEEFNEIVIKLNTLD
ncbi:MAG: DNA primase [Candidatus Buchananbacteria bacterium]